MFLAAMPKFMFSQTLETRNIGNTMRGGSPGSSPPQPPIRAVRASSQASRAAGASRGEGGRMRRWWVRGSAGAERGRMWASRVVRRPTRSIRNEHWRMSSTPVRNPGDPRSVDEISDICDQFEPLISRKFGIIYYFSNHPLPYLFFMMYRDQGGPPIRVPHE